MLARACVFVGGARGAVYIVMQFANGGNLYEALTSTKHGRFSEKKTARYMKQLVECVWVFVCVVWVWGGGEALGRVHPHTHVQ